MYSTVNKIFCPTYIEYVSDTLYSIGYDNHPAILGIIKTLDIKDSYVDVYVDFPAFIISENKLRSGQFIRLYNKDNIGKFTINKATDKEYNLYKDSLLEFLNDNNKIGYFKYGRFYYIK